MVNSEGKFRYSCVCGKSIKSRSSFNRHVKVCKEYQKQAIEVGYLVECKLCETSLQVLTHHINKNHPEISPEEYCIKYNASLKSKHYEENALQKILKGRKLQREEGERRKETEKLNEGAVLCRICKKPFHQLSQHLRQTHSITKKDYLNMHPGAPMLSDSFKKAASERGKTNGNWIARVNESGKDLSEYKDKMGKAVSKSIMANNSERKRRSSLLKKMWKDPEKKKIFKENQSKTAIITSARPDIQEARSKRLKKWREENPEDFYEKCTKIMHSKWSSIPEKSLRDFCQEINPNFKWNQQLNTKKYFKVNKTGRKQIDLIDKGSRIIIELDGPHHFLPIFGDETLAKNIKKDNELNSYCLENNFTLIRVSHKQFSYRKSSKGFSKNCLTKVREIIKNKAPGLYCLGKEYGEKNLLNIGD